MLPLTFVQPSKLWIYATACRPLMKHMHHSRWLHAACLENYCWITVVLSRNNCVFSQRVLKQRVSGQEESAFWLDGLEDSVSRSTLSYFVRFCLCSPIWLFKYFNGWALNPFVFLLFTSYRIYRSNWTAAIAAFSLARYNLSFPVSLRRKSICNILLLRSLLLLSGVNYSFMSPVECFMNRCELQSLIILLMRLLTISISSVIQYAEYLSRRAKFDFDQVWFSFISVINIPCNFFVFTLWS